MLLQGGKSKMKDEPIMSTLTYKLDELNDSLVLFSKSSGKQVI